MALRGIEPLRVPEAFWLRDDVQTALAARDLGTLFKLFMKHSGGGSQTQLGATIRMEQGHVSNFVNRKRGAISIEVLERVADGLAMPDPCRILLGLAPVTRNLVTVGAVQTERSLFTSAADRAASFYAWAESTNVGQNGIANLHQSVSDLATDYLSDSPVEIVQRTTILASRVFNLLKGHQWPSQTRELYLAAGRINVLLSWISGDLGYGRTARTHGDTALLCAEMIDDSDLRVWALSVQSKNAFWAQRYDDAAALAAEGRSYASTGTAPVFLSCQEADAWAEAGAHHEAALALERARDAREQLDGADSVGGLLGCDDTRYQNYVGAVLLRLGQNSAAVELADEALRASANYSGKTGYGTVAQVRIWAAQAHVRAAEIDGAIEVLQPVLSLPGGKRLETVASRLREVHTEIAHCAALTGSKSVQELMASIDEY